MKYLALSSLLFLAACAVAPQWSLEDYAANSSVRLGNSERDFCSGTIIGYNKELDYSIILTAAHCTHETGDYHVTITTEDGSFTGATKQYSASLLGKDDGDDVAIYVMSHSIEHCVPVARSFSQVRGTQIWAISSPLMAYFNAVSTGIVEAPARLTTFGEFTVKAFLADIAIFPGSSGGAIVDKTGKIIGTITGGVQLKDIPTSIVFISVLENTNDLIDGLNLEGMVCR